MNEFIQRDYRGQEEENMLNPREPQLLKAAIEQGVTDTTDVAPGRERSAVREAKADRGMTVSWINMTSVRMTPPE